MKFEVGEVVTVSKPSSTYAESFRGKRGVVTGVDESQSYPVVVTTEDGWMESFLEKEVTSAGMKFTMSQIESTDVPTLFKWYEQEKVLDAEAKESDEDEVNHPSHYRWLPNGVEVIDITENLNFNLGNVVKYVLRAGHKHDEPLTDLRKAAWYVNREIVRLETM